MKILNFGSCNLDYVYTMDHIVAPGETESTDSFQIFPGGKGLNQSIAAARAGADVSHAGCIGTDGETLKTILRESGVNVSYLQTVPSKNGHAIIQVSKAGENSIFLYPGSNQMLKESQIDAVLEDFCQGDILLLQNETNLVSYLVEAGFRKGMKIVLNPSPFNARICEIDFSHLSYLILNEVEAREISGKDLPEEALDWICGTYPNLTVVLTLGAYGSVYQDSQKRLYQSAYHVTPVDTTAAGDTFTGYFFACLSQGWKEEVCLQVASAASGIAVSRMGAAPSIPLRREVEEALACLSPSETVLSSAMQKVRIFRYLEDSLQDASLKDLAKFLGYSASYTGTVVRQVTGIPFSKLLQRIRCDRAAKLLSETTLSVGEITYRVGYKNETFFRNIFRERYGESPLRYRKNRRGESL